MPIYAYRCEGCGFQKDALQKLSDPPLTDCPQCGEPKFAKQLTAAGFALKGSGWYVTDFRNSQAKPAAGKSDATPSANQESSKPTAPPTETTATATQAGPTTQAGASAKTAGAA